MQQKTAPDTHPHNDSNTESELAANTQQQERANLIKGIGIAFLTDAIALVLLSLIGFALGIGLSDSTQIESGYVFLIGFVLLMLVGFWQFLVILPLIVYLKFKQQAHLIKGVLIGSGLILLFNSLTCAGIMSF